jgi:hypothetical protein
MKKLILLFFASLSLLSCSNDDANNYYYEILPIESYEVPASFNFGEVYTITLFYKKPNDCHFNQSLYFEKKDSTRIIAIQSSVIDRANCQPLPDQEPIKGTFQFEVLKTTSYIFKFYKGKDENGENTFEDVIIPVIN